MFCDSFFLALREMLGNFRLVKQRSAIDMEIMKVFQEGLENSIQVVRMHLLAIGSFSRVISDLLNLKT